ncbi:hypothetical protein, partial [Nitrosospira sp. NpAV]|uniref:hypothetical protein n=1 Tax=Nitrosospira sp. NpAV TaxID=58133 RepID=UPI0018DCBB77
EQLKTEKIEQQYWQRKHEELTNELFSKRFFRKLESLKPGDEYFSEKKLGSQGAGRVHGVLRTVNTIHLVYVFGFYDLCLHW